MKATVIIENSVPISSPKPFCSEHGYSLLIEVDSVKILLDAGQSDAVMHNMALLDVDPNQLDAVIVSHGHYDHTGGLKSILQHRSKPLPIYGHQSIFQSRFSIGGNRHYIGIPYSKEELTSLGAEWRLSSEIQEITPKLVFSGQIPRETPYETGDPKLVIADGQCDCQDPIYDDTALYYSSAKGLVAIAGCSHSGLVNTVEYGLKIMKQKKFAGWIGGTHLGPAGSEQQEKTLAKLEEYQPYFIAASHCTGFYIMAELQRRFGSRFIPAFTGQIIEMD
ncbi:MAG: MBL fold metallo-hydrolase [Veillonellaceae bacterium]|jgi:7,8-dihydropterin-6-yl-methyl-4-(beta-D-ribofuranosyl)aminobenzene 5'-phosphate synthase|nr:MBL fold metallo-hydrolase [Veillonellaceae bacterium]